MPTCRYRRVRESHPMVWEGSGGPPCFEFWVGFCPGCSPDPSRPFARACRPLSSFRDSLPTPPDPLRPSWKASHPIPALQMGLLTPPRFSGRVSGRLPAHRECLPTLPGPQGGPANPSQPFQKASQPFSSPQALQEVLPTHPGPSRGPPDTSNPLLDLRVGLLTTPGPPGMLPDPSQPTGWASHPSWPSGWASQTLPDHWVGLPTSQLLHSNQEYLIITSGQPKVSANYLR